MEQLTEDCETLKAENATLKQELGGIKLELDNANQQLYECQRNVRVLTSIQAEYQNEVDMLQSEQIKQKQKYQDIIKQLEQNINNMRDNYNDEKQTFENVIMKMEEKNEQLKSELDVYKGCYDNNVTNFGDTSSLIQDILSEPPEFYENQQLKDSIKELRSKNENLTRQVEEYTNEIENLKESYNCTRTDLHEANTNIQFLNDEILCLKSELDSFKNRPLNKDSRGNSLFAEVDDRRVYLQDKMNKMSATYVAMTQEKAHLQNSNYQLKLENMRLLEKWKSDVEEKENDDHEVTVALRSRIDDLEKLIEKYKKELLEKPVVFSKRNFEEIEYYSLTLNEKNKEIQSLKDDISAKSLDRFLLSTSLRESNEEKRKWRLEAMKYQHELELLRRETAQNTQEKIKETHPQKSQLSPENKNTKEDFKEKVQENVIDVMSEQYQSNKTSSLECLSDIQEEHEITLKDNSNLQTETLNPRFTMAVFDESLDSVDIKQINNISTKRRECILLEKDESISIEKSTSTCSNKENVSDSQSASTNQTRKVSFAENIVSPKRTERRGGKRIIATKTFYFKD